MISKLASYFFAAAGAVTACAQIPSLPLAPCRELSDQGRAHDAAACYSKALRPTLDPAAARAAWLGLAHNRQWSGNGRGAIVAYRTYLTIGPAERAVTLEYIQALRYRGAYAEAERLCDALIRTNPRDAEALALRAEILFWAGNRAFQARDDASAALEIAPELTSAHVSHAAALDALGLHRTAWRELHSDHLTSDMAHFLENRVEQEKGFGGEAPVSVYNDSDGIHDAVYESIARIPIRGDHRLEAKLDEYTSSAPSGSVFSDGRTRASMRDFSVGGTALVSPGLHLSLAAGGSWTYGGSPAGSSVRPIYRAAFDGSPRDRWTIALSAERQFLAVTPRAIDQAIRYDDATAEIRRHLGARAWASINFGHRVWSDGNRSEHADADASRTLLYDRKFNLDAGPSASFQAFSRDMTANSGFFTPDRYSRYDGFLAAHGEAGRKLTWEVRGEGGSQQITSTSDFSPEWGVRARLSIRMGAGLRLYGSYERKNYSLLGRDGWYQGFYISLGIHP